MRGSTLAKRGAKCENHTCYQYTCIEHDFSVVLSARQIVGNMLLSCVERDFSVALSVKQTVGNALLSCTKCGIECQVERQTLENTKMAIFGFFRESCDV